MTTSNRGHTRLLTLRLPFVVAIEQKVYSIFNSLTTAKGEKILLGTQKSPTWGEHRKTQKNRETSKVIINEETGIALTQTGLQNL